MNDRIWLHHPETDGYFHCPADAKDTFLDLGWELTESGPPETNPVVAERIAFERTQQEAAARRKAEQEAETTTSTDKPRRGTSQAKEG